VFDELLDKNKIDNVLGTARDEKLRTGARPSRHRGTAAIRAVLDAHRRLNFVIMGLHLPAGETQTCNHKAVLAHTWPAAPPSKGEAPATAASAKLMSCGGGKVRERKKRVYCKVGATGLLSAQALLTPEGNPTYFHERFCKEAPAASKGEGERGWGRMTEDD
jgi:hypothetical protein